MTEKNQHAVDIQQIEHGLKMLQRRKWNLTAAAVVLSAVGVASLISLFFQQEWVFNMFGVAQHVHQLHLPYMVDQQLRDAIYQPDYLMNAFSWLGWLILKLIVSFIGAFFVIKLLKKLRFFLVRFQSFILKFVAWLIAFIVIWSGLTYVQYDLKDEGDKELKAFVRYDQNIQHSNIYQYLSKSELPEPVQNYLLAQTALMHKPVDQVVATVYAEKLIKAEQGDPQFLEYGFKPEQLWTIQHQVFDQAVSSLAKGVEVQINRANFWSNIVEKILWGIGAIGLVLGLFFYLIAYRMSKRLQRIGHRMS
ncbi:MULTISPECIES: hypothetical protein [Acinetobacter]|uniref:hypothetical protein n=1 Tax=Acinetobacter TaxID=469 RepID=UPI0002AEB0D0|nr:MULTISPECIES: hypothetical protein [Acinetobacter]ELW86495.1 hypothetical protein ACINWC743_2978 [Acinetobacter sp. WC-743]MBJ8427037.1 hypothetical protein [Acinetobacter bereziniae]MBJ8475029.1 hypothetical protein [Acinetobacter bereziniae]